MPRVPKPQWKPGRPGKGGGYWQCRAFGPISPKTGRPTGVYNREIGPPTGKDGAANRLAASRWIDELVAGDRDAERRADNPTFADLAESYCAWSLGDGREARTIDGHRERLSRFCGFRAGNGPPIGDRAAAELRPADLARFVSSLTGEGYSPVYVNSLLISVHACLNWAARPVPDRMPERILPANPFAGLARPKVPAPPKRYCGAESRRAFLAFGYRRLRRHPAGSAARLWDRQFVRLLRFCESSGCRPSEAARLEWSHVEWEDARAVLKGKSTHATGRQRVIPLPPVALGMLRLCRRRKDCHPRFVFVHGGRPKGGGMAGDRVGVPWSVHALDQKVRHWREEAIEAGLPVAAEGPAALTLYAFRRDLGADVLRMTGSHAASAEVLGHSAAVNERHYASFADDYAVGLAAEVEKRRRPGPGPSST